MRTLYNNTTTTPIGQIKLAGLLDKTQSMAFETMRVFGKYAIVYLLEGSGVYFDTNRYRQKLTAGSLLLLFPELAHNYGPQYGEVWKELYVVFEGPVFDLWRETGLLSSRQPVLHLEPVVEWSRKLGFLLHAGRSGSSGNPEEHLLEVCRFLSVLSEALRVSGATPTGLAGEPWLHDACHLLGTNLEQSLTFEAVAEQVGLSQESFRKKFRREMGMAPAHYRTVKRIEAAQALMEHTRLTNGEIAERLGFCDPFHFARRFKQITGVSPREYRQRRQRDGRYGLD